MSKNAIKLFLILGSDFSIRGGGGGGGGPEKAEISDFFWFLYLCVTPNIIIFVHFGLSAYRSK